jgi:hypothetical protein
MRQYMITAVAIVAVILSLAGSAPGQDINGTIRTYQGVSYNVADLSLEVLYTIGEPKSIGHNPSQVTGLQPSGPLVSVTNMGGTPSGGEQPGGGGAAEERLLRGHSRTTEITVWRQGVETRIPLDQIRAMRFGRKPVTAAGAGLRMPPYVPDYKYSASVILITGERVEADYVNLGATIVRGTAPNGQVEIPWGEVESIIFER